MFHLFRPTFVFAFLLLFSYSPPISTGAQPVATHAYLQSRPNIIVIILDDLDKRSMEFMPNVKRELIDRGMHFKNYFVNVPTCCPSRASLFRGQYAHNTKVLRNRGANGGFSAFRKLESSTVATWLHDVGYRTGLFGKYLNGYPGTEKQYIPPGWDQWHARVRGFYRNYSLNDNGSVVRYGKKDEDYETDIYADKLIDFISQNNGQAPFFAYLAPLAPHVPTIPAVRHQDLFAGALAPRIPSFNETDVSDKPKRIRLLKPLDDGDIAAIDHLYQSRLECMLAVDELIGRMFEALRKVSQLDNTYIFFTSDNGFHLGEHRIPIGKDTPYDEATNVPFIARGPGINKKCFNTLFAQNIDIAPTLAELAGAKLPSFVDGKSLVPTFTHDKKALAGWKREALIEHWTNNEGNQPNFIALRTSSYLYVEHDSGEFELYDINTDPYQMESIYRTADQSLIRELSKRLKELSRSTAENASAAQHGK